MHTARPRTRIKAQNKSLKEAERRVGQTKAANQQGGAGDRASSTRRRSSGAHTDKRVPNSGEACMDTNSTHDTARGVSFKAAVVVEAGTGGLPGDDRNLDKEV